MRAVNKRVRVEIRFKDKGKRPRLLRRLRTNRNGYFMFRNRYREKRRWFARVRLGDRRVEGPHLKAYRLP